MTATATTAPEATRPARLPAFFAPVAADFEAANALILEQLQSKVPLVEKIGHYIIAGGGKRLRPLVVLLTARALGYDGERHRDLATIIEFLHTATLLHDDVVDASDLRRGRSTANAVFGNAPSVLVGDFLYSRAFERMVEIGSMRVMELLARATNVIAEGEVMQLANVRNPNLQETDYMEVIRCKTAMLFEVSSHTAAVLAGADPATEESLRDYGLHLGLAFQLIDDLLDYDGETGALGKNVGDDLEEGKTTLPLIHAMRQGTPAQADLVRGAIRRNGREQLPAVLAVLRDTGALQYTRQAAEQQIEQALACLAPLPPSAYRTALEQLARFSIRRSH